jgi:hypothetical protein
VSGDLKLLFHELEDILEHTGGLEQFDTYEIPCLVEFHINTRGNLDNLCLFAFLSEIKDILFVVVINFEILHYSFLYLPDLCPC